MNFEEKNDVVNDGKRNIGGLPFIIFVLLVCIAGSVYFVVTKHNDIGFSSNISGRYVSLLVAINVVTRLFGIVFLITSLVTVDRDLSLDNGDIKWYRAVIYFMIGFILIVFGPSIVTSYARPLIDFYY